MDERTQQALDRFERFLHRKDLRLTEARAAIVEAALARDGHYPIDELIADLKKRGIRGSKATVYRTLPLLAEAGILEPAILAGETRSYETTFGRNHHDHLICSRCARVIEFEFEAFEILQRDVATKYGFRLEAHHHELIGICPECVSREGAHEGAHVRADGVAHPPAAAATLAAGGQQGGEGEPSPGARAGSPRRARASPRSARGARDAHPRHHSP